MHGKIPINLHKPLVEARLVHQPAVRLLVTFLAVAVAVSLHSPLLLTVIAAVTTAVMLWCGIPLKHIGQRLLLIVPFALGAVILLPFTIPGETTFRLLGLSASSQGISQSVLILLKIICANLFLTALLSTTPMFDLIRSLRIMGIPSVMIEIITLMMRYFFLLTEEMASILKAQKARGFSTKGWFWSSRMYRRFGEMIGILFVRAYRRSQRVYQSMSARGGFEGGLVRHSSINEDLSSEAETAIELQRVSYAYSEHRWALSEVSLAVPKGVKVALMGANGAGKSTLISLLNGLEEPTRGEVRIFGQKIGPSNRDQIRLQVGVVYQDPDDQIFSHTIEEDVAFGPRNAGVSGSELEERVERALKSVGMFELRKRSPFELSYGQKRRVAIAGVLAMEPRILILDEPMAFLDPRSRDELQVLLDELNRRKMTILVTTHDVDFAAEWADQVILLQRGKILASGSTDLLFDDELIERADLHLPRLARPFRLLKGLERAMPKTVEEAACLIEARMNHEK